MSAPVIRRAEAGQWAELRELWVAAWKATAIDLDFDARRPWFSRHAQALAAAGYAVDVAMREGRLLGFVIFNPGTGHVDQLAMHPRAQGGGAATALIDHVKALCPGGLKLDVNQDNLRAVRFYLREGFVITGEGISQASGLKLHDMVWRVARPPPPGAG